MRGNSVYKFTFSKQNIWTILPAIEMFNKSLFGGRKMDKSIKESDYLLLDNLIIKLFIPTQHRHQMGADLTKRGSKDKTERNTSGKKARF